MTISKVALITASSRGIGAETALLFAKNGYSIVLNYLHSEAAAFSVRDELIALGVSCIAVKADVSKPDDVEKLFLAADELGPLSVLVNNVGVLKTQARLEDISYERFKTILEINVLSCFLCTQAAIKRMSTRHGGAGGAIVNVSSGAAKSGSPNEYTDYAASKGAMDTLTRGAALELAEEGIRVNAVRPGLVYTDIHAAGGEPNRVERLAENLPLKRGGQPQEVAEAIYWLGSEKSSYVTGSFIDATGGL